MPKNHSERVKNHFTQEWEEYDSKISKAIPFYKESFDTLISILHGAGINPKRILEIGVGTGNLTNRLLQEFPQTSLVGIDLVEDYIIQAKQKLSVFEDRIKLSVKDVIDFDFIENYDLVITSYVFHHIENNTKSSIYKKIYTHLNPDGMFVNADFVDSSSSYFSNLFDQLRMEYMRSRGFNEDSIKSYYTEHRKLETPMPIEEQITLLSQIGFRDVECFWKYLNLAVFGGIK